MDGNDRPQNGSALPGTKLNTPLESSGTAPSIP
jgi:hypothetical protein